MITLTDIDERVQLIPPDNEPRNLTAVKAICVANRRVELDDQLGARRFFIGDSFVLAALIDSQRYALVIDTRQTGLELQWSDCVYLVASADLQLLDS
jgi:hypothetical protein